MARKRHRKGGRVTPKGTRPRHLSSVPPLPPSSPPPSPADEPSLGDDINQALGTGEPLDLLALASTLLSAVDPRERRPFLQGPDALPVDELPTKDDLLGMLARNPDDESAALLAAMSALAGDDPPRLAALDRLPTWLSRLDQAAAHRTVEMVHVLGDGDNVMIGLRLAPTRELTVVVYIDHNLGTLVKDAFVLPAAIDEVVEMMRSTADDPDTVWRDLDRADARVRITEAIELGAMTLPPFESDTWPACRPIVEWATAMLPTGGTGYERPTWPDPDRAALADRFFTSPHGAAFDDEDHRSLLESLLWFGCDYGPGDPLRWSPVAVEIVLLDWVPRKIVADRAYLEKLPPLLAAYVRFCHAERSIPTYLTDETTAAVDAFAEEYHRLIASPRAQGVAALVEAMDLMKGEGPWDPDDPWDTDDSWDDEPWDDEPWDAGTWALALLADAVGGMEALDALDDRPLPDEEFTWDGIPSDIHPRVREILGRCDEGCDALFDVEHRTACRRLLAHIATESPVTFRRASKVDTTAAAICWIIGKANDTFRQGPLQVRDLTTWFGVSPSVSDRGNSLLRAVGGPYRGSTYSTVALGDTRYLVAGRRRNLIAERDRRRAAGP